MPGRYVALTEFRIDPALCKGCAVCARNCPVDAINGEIKHPFTIDPAVCIKCGAVLHKGATSK